MRDKKIFAGRVNSLDLYRGIALASVIFFHTAIFNYGGLHTVNFDNPSPLIIAIGLMGLWGGIFITLSLITSTVSILRRLSMPKSRTKTPLYILLASSLYMVLHYVLTFFLGRWELNPASPTNKLTLPAELLRNQQLPQLNFNAFFDGSILSTISLNLLLVGMIVYLLFRNPSQNNEKRAYAVLGLLGITLAALSFSRHMFYPLISDAIQSQQYITASLLGWFVGFPYPIVSYALYGVMGAIVGVMVYYERLYLIRRVIFPIGLLTLIIGIAGCLSQPITFNKPDMFWQWKTIADLGMFLLLAVLALGIVQPRQHGLRGWSIFLWFSRISLTIYLLETTMSEILRHAWFVLIPGWDRSITGTLLFSAFNILWWFAVVYIWSRYEFRYSLEYFWAKLFKKVGLNSSKLDDIQNL